MPLSTLLTFHNDRYGFYLDPNDVGGKRKAGSDADGAGNGPIQMHTPYHYYENNTYDKSAKDPWRPWTYRFHNFELEHQKFRQLQHACWLDLITSDSGASR